MDWMMVSFLAFLAISMGKIYLMFKE